MKKFISIGLILMILLGQFGVVGAAEGETPVDPDDTVIVIDSVVTEQNGNKNKVEIGNFELTITLKVEPGSGSVDDLYVQVGSSSSFSPKGTGSKVKVVGSSAKFNMYYNGGTDTKIPITITYKKGEKMLSTDDYISITNIKPYEEPKEDTSKKVPNLGIIGPKTITVEAGDSTYFPITVKNTSNEGAENITISAELDDASPISIDGSDSDSIRGLSPSRARDIDFRISVGSNAESNTYPIKVNFHFYNYDGDPFTASDTIYVKVENKNTSPLITIGKVETTPTVAEPGKATNIKLQLKNTGTLEAKDVKISLNNLENDTFTLSSGTNTQYIKSISGGDTDTIYFQITPSEKLAGGNHGIELGLSYKDSKGTPHEDSSKFFVNVASNKGKNSNLIMENLKYPEGPVGQNQTATISFNLKNIGKIDAKNIKVMVESSDTSGIVPKTVSTKKINSLAPGKSESLSFVFLTGKDAETRNYPINITVEYDDDLSSGEEKYNLTQYVGVFVVKPGDDIKTTPRLIIDKYNFEPNLVKAGENFTMNLSFFNTNSQKTR